MTKIQSVRNNVLDASSPGGKASSVKLPESVHFGNGAFPLCVSGHHRKDQPTFDPSGRCMAERRKMGEHSSSCEHTLDGQ